MMEFHVSKKMRDTYKFDLALFSTNGNVIFTDFKNVRLFAHKINKSANPEHAITAGQLNAMGLIDEIFHIVCQAFRDTKNAAAFEELLTISEKKLGKKNADALLSEFTAEFPPLAVYRDEISIKDYLAGQSDGVSNGISTLEEMLVLHLANENPAFKPFSYLFNDEKLTKNPQYQIS
ncbi:MAG: alpha-amylase, partial [Spirochaetales bacterium]